MMNTGDSINFSGSFKPGFCQTVGELLPILAEVCRGRGRGVCARLQEIWRAHAGGKAIHWILEGFSVQFSVPRYFRFENPNPKVKKREKIYPPNIIYIYFLPKNSQSHLREKSKTFSPRFSQLAPGSWQQWRGWRGVLDSQGQRRNSVPIPWHSGSSPAKGTKKYGYVFPRIWDYCTVRHGYGSIPIDTIFRGMNIHLPAILMFTRGTRVLTHPQISRYRVYQPGVSHHYGGMTHDPTKTSEIIIPKLAPLESTSKIIIPKHWTPLESREFERLPLGGDWRHVPASRKAGG